MVKCLNSIAMNASTRAVARESPTSYRPQRRWSRASLRRRGASDRRVDAARKVENDVARPAWLSCRRQGRERRSRQTPTGRDEKITTSQYDVSTPPAGRRPLRRSRGSTVDASARLRSSLGEFVISSESAAGGAALLQALESTDPMSELSDHGQPQSNELAVKTARPGLTSSARRAVGEPPRSSENRLRLQEEGVVHWGGEARRPARPAKIVRRRSAVFTAVIALRPGLVGEARSSGSVLARAWRALLPRPHSHC